METTIFHIFYHLHLLFLLSTLGLDDDYLNQGNNPGKRSFHNKISQFRARQKFLNQQQFLALNPYQYALFRKRNCLNLGGDACANGELVGSGYDDDYLNQAGFNPGK